MQRLGSHMNPPPRLPGETTEEYLDVLRTCDWEFTPAERAARNVVTKAPTRPTAPESRQNLAERRFGHGTPLPPKLATAHKPTRESRVLERVPCPICSTPFAPRVTHHGSRRKTCSPACGSVLAARTTRAKAQPRELVPCPVCETPFVPRTNGRGTPSQTCSISCSRKLGAATRDSAEYRARLSAAAVGRKHPMSEAHREHLRQSVLRYHAERRAEVAS